MSDFERPRRKITPTKRLLEVDGGIPNAIICFGEPPTTIDLGDDEEEEYRDADELSFDVDDIEAMPLSEVKKHVKKRDIIEYIGTGRDAW
jgi:hypothetical protein